MSVIEVQVADEAGRAWLRERGFRPASAGWWLRVVPRGEKRHLLAEMAAGLGEALQDVNVRELQALELAGASQAPEANGGG